MNYNDLKATCKVVIDPGNGKIVQIQKVKNAINIGNTRI